MSVKGNYPAIHHVKYGVLEGISFFVLSIDRGQVATIPGVIYFPLYASLAVLTSSWFILPSTSYGIWSAHFCDVLGTCQTIIALFNDQPEWYLVVQVLTLLGWLSLLTTTVLLVSPSFSTLYLPFLHRIKAFNRLHTIAAFCILSACVISTSIIVFYTKLDESSPENHPEMSWSAGLAIIACILEFVAGLLLMSSEQQNRGRLWV